MTFHSIANVLCEQLTLDIKVNRPNFQGMDIQSMRRKFRSYRPNEATMVLQVPKTILPSDHKAFFTIDLVKCLDLSEIFSAYNTGSGRGRPPYDPVMMVTLLVYSYLSGCESSRKIEEATFDVLPCRMITGNEHPDHDTINEFRRKHLPVLAKLFEQSVKLAQAASMISFKHVAHDGSKFKASASKNKAMSYARMCQTIERYEKEIPEIKKKIGLANKGKMQVYPGQLLELYKDLKIREERLPVIELSKMRLEK